MQFLINKKFITQKELEEILLLPNWYLVLEDFLREHYWEYQKNKEGKSEEWFLESDRFLDFISKQLDKNLVALNDKNLGMDVPRKNTKLDTIVIHHSSRDGSEDIRITSEGLSLIRIYGQDFANNSNRYFGKPISSDHYYNGKMTFMPYHYVIWPDGKLINYLPDSALTKHCGNFEYNKRSIAICFHSELEEAEPTEKAIETARKLISKYKDFQILGHREISNTTICPGNKFLGENGWKRKLLIR